MRYTFEKFEYNGKTYTEITRRCDGHREIVQGNLDVEYLDKLHNGKLDEISQDERMKSFAYLYSQLLEVIQKLYPYYCRETELLDVERALALMLWPPAAESVQELKNLSEETINTMHHVELLALINNHHKKLNEAEKCRRTHSYPPF